MPRIFGCDDDDATGSNECIAAAHAHLELLLEFQCSIEARNISNDERAPHILDSLCSGPLDRPLDNVEAFCCAHEISCLHLHLSRLPKANRGLVFGYVHLHTGATVEPMLREDELVELIEIQLACEPDIHTSTQWSFGKVRPQGWDLRVIWPGNEPYHSALLSCGWNDDIARLWVYRFEAEHHVVQATCDEGHIRRRHEERDRVDEVVEAELHHCFTRRMVPPCLGLGLKGVM